MPERDVQTGIGQVTVRKPRVRDRDPGVPGGAIRFTSAIPPNYLRRAKSVEDLLPWLYPKGICGGDFSEVLTALLGPDAPGLAASTITRPKTVWWDEYEAWPRRDLVEAEFATVRLGTVKTKGYLSRKTALAMAFKLILSARRKWRKLDGSNQIAEVIKGVPFKDGSKQIKCAA